VTFELLTDYRVGEVPIGNRYSFEDSYQVPAEESTFEMLVLMADSIGVTTEASDSDWIDYSNPIFTENGILNITVEENTTGLERTGYVNLKYFYGDVQIIQIPITQNA
jgi:hypothetical protein